MTPADLLQRELRRDGARPLLTWYDDAAGARVELSVVTAGNWAAKVAGMLADDHDLEPGDAVAVALPAHWQTVVVMLGVWLAGGCVTFGGPARVGFRSEAASAVDADATVDLSLHPMGADLSRLVGGQPDTFVAVSPVDPAAPALRLGGREWTHERLGDSAVAAARHHGVDAAGRVLSTAGFDSVDGIDAGLLVPLAAGASVVLVSNADAGGLAERCAAEHVTHVAGVSVDGLPRLM